MADISNQLHDAVDNILSSFATRCISLPPTNAMIVNPKPSLYEDSIQNSLTLKGGS